MAKRTQRTKDTVVFSAEVAPDVADMLRDGAMHGDIKRRFETAVLAFFGAPGEHQEDAILHLVRCRRSDREPDPADLYGILMNGAVDGISDKSG